MASQQIASQYHYILIAAVTLGLLGIVNCIPKAASAVHHDPKQLFIGPQAKETTTTNFVRLFVMRLIYGIASTMGLEERLAEVFNGAFVPPGEEESDYGFDFDGVDGIFEER